MKNKFEKAQKLRDNGQIEEALILYSEAREEFLEKKDLKNAAECLHMIGVAYYQAKKFDEATKYLELALGEFAEIDDEESIGFTLRDLGLVAKGLGNLSGAKKYLLESIEKLKNNPGHQGMAIVKLGRVLAECGELDEAFVEIEKGIKLLEKSNEKFFLSSAYLDRAKVDAQKSLAVLDSFAAKDEFKKRREEIAKILS